MATTCRPSRKAKTRRRRGRVVGAARNSAPAKINLTLRGSAGALTVIMNRQPGGFSPWATLTSAGRTLSCRSADSAARAAADNLVSKQRRLRSGRGPALRFASKAPAGRRGGSRGGSSVRLRARLARAGEGLCARRCPVDGGRRRRPWPTCGCLPRSAPAHAARRRTSSAPHAFPRLRDAGTCGRSRSPPDVFVERPRRHCRRRRSRKMAAPWGWCGRESVSNWRPPK
jgi:hypothetical protein